MAAKVLSQTEDLLWNLSDQLEPKDGVSWIYDGDGIETRAFTDFDLEPARD